ncbi:PEP/pyruvate-binding domain-containing protein [Desulfobulbus sp.]|uniref:PEP/pyruvate-binding domain-containing protein n=1 Tax=Desulfobulbus sp. TaxID=895 RepID=UPI00286EE3AB|nr:PEP/pyruvate-binding domain-containing protein [Desulfobulbus sp.]
MPVGALFKHWSLRLWAPDRVVRHTYEAFKILLDLDGRCHELMAEFEAVYHENRYEDLARTRGRYRLFGKAVAGMVSALERMHPGRSDLLRAYYDKYDFYARLLLAPPEEFLIPPFVLNHQQPLEPRLAGNKAVQLLRSKQEAQASIPEGFTIATTTFSLLVAHNQLRPAIDLLLAGIDPEDDTSLRTASQALMTLVRQLEIPDRIKTAILDEYDRLATMPPGGAPLVAVRSSALLEDGVHSFAGQYRSVLGVGRDGLLAAYREVVASKYTPEALLYRIRAGIGDEEAAMAVLVTAMVDGAASGVVYTRDPASGDGPLLLHAVHGLGLPLVGGETVPAVLTYPFDSDLAAEQTRGRQRYQLILVDNRLCEVPLADEQAARLPLNPEQGTELVRLARQLEHLFDGPQDIEWTLTADGRLYLLQVRPLHLEKAAPARSGASGPAIDCPPLLAGARRAAGFAAHGTVRHFSASDDHPPPEKTVLVTRHLPPSLARHLPNLAAVVCEQGSTTGHFATVCRESGVVLLVEAEGALAALPQGMEVTVDGGTAAVYPGRIESLLADGARQPPADSAFRRRLGALLQYITPLHLLDPADPEFRPQACRSLHDVIRFAHETAMRTMFGLGDISGGALSRCRRLASPVPLDVLLLDVGGGFADAGADTIALESVHSTPFLALWQGLGHPEIEWNRHPHFDWQEFGDMALSGGIVAETDKHFASYAVVGADYVNLNLRFGFHFTQIDCLCGDRSQTNYCRLRFAGGGGAEQGRRARIELLRQVLERLGFAVTVKSLLLDASLSGCPPVELRLQLESLGRLLGLTKQLDLSLREEEIDRHIDAFFKGIGAR